MHGNRIYRLLLVGGVALVGLLAATDVVALQVYQSRGGAQIARSMAAERASLDLGGLPFLPSYLRGRSDEVRVDVVGASGGGLRVADLQIRMRDVRYDTSDMFGLLRSRYAARTTLRGEEVFGRMEIAERDLELFVRSHEPVVEDIVISTSGVQVVFGPTDEDQEDEDGEERVARFLPRVEERRLVLRAVGRAGFSRELRETIDRLEDLIDLPRIPEGLQSDVRLGNGVFAVEASGPEVSLEIGEGGSQAAEGWGPGGSRPAWR